MTEADVRKIVKDVLKSELSAIKDDVSTMKKKYVDEQEVKKIVRKMIINQYKWMWEKSSIFVNNL
jgi:hypothetical protein